MTGLDADVVVHRLPLEPENQSIKHNLRRMKPEWTIKVKQKVVKRYKAGFRSREISRMVREYYAQAKERWDVRMSVNFRYLRKASRKDESLLHRDVLFDSNAGHAMLFLLTDFWVLTKLRWRWGTSKRLLSSIFGKCSVIKL